MNDDRNKLTEIMTYIMTHPETPVGQSISMIMTWADHRRDKAVEESRGANDGLYTEIVKRLAPYFPKDSHDLDWDMLPSTIESLAARPSNADVSLIIPAKIANEIGLRCVFFGDEERGPCFDHELAEQILSKWLKEAVFSELGEKYANWDALLHALRCAREENKRLIEKL